jgi:hypothetical protein
VVTELPDFCGFSQHLSRAKLNGMPIGQQAIDIAHQWNAKFCLVGDTSCVEYHYRGVEYHYVSDRLMTDFPIPTPKLASAQMATMLD